MSRLVECECGHQFFTKKEKPLCIKCGKRFDVIENTLNVEHPSNGSSLDMLQAQCKRQVQIVEGLMTRLQVEQTELKNISKQIQNYL